MRTVLGSGRGAYIAKVLRQHLQATFAVRGSNNEVQRGGRAAFSTAQLGRRALPQFLAADFEQARAREVRFVPDRPAADALVRFELPVGAVNDLGRVSARI